MRKIRQIKISPAILRFAVLFLSVACAVSALAAPPEKVRPKNVRAGFFHFSGYHMINQYDERCGYGYDYLQNMARHTGWRLEYVGFDRSWDDMLEMLSDGSIDMLTSARKTPAREEMFDYSELPIGFSSAIMTVKAGNTRYIAGDYANWNDIRVGLLEGNSRNNDFANFAETHGFTYKPVYFRTLDELINALHDGERIDAIVTSNLRSVKGEWVYASFSPSPFYVIVKKGNKALLDEINRAISAVTALTPGLQTELWDKYYSVDSGSDISFSAEERNFIKTCNANGIVFDALVNPDRMPLSFIEDGNLQGILVDITQEIAKRTGLNIRTAPAADRGDYRQKTESGDFPIILDAWNNPARYESFGYKLSRPYFRTTVSKLHRRDSANPPRTLAAVRSSDTLRGVERNAAGAMPVMTFFDSVADAVEAVKDGRCDAVYLHTRTAELAEFYDDLGVIHSEIVPGFTNQYAIAVKNDAPALLSSIIGKAASSLKPQMIQDAVSRYSRQPAKPFSMIGYFYGNPVKTILIPFGLLTLLAIFLVLVLFGRRKSYRTAEIIKKLPVHFYVADREGNILLYSQGDDPDKKRVLKTAYDIPGIQHEEYIKALNEVIDTGIMRGFEYTAYGHWRSAFCYKLPRKLFHRDTVLWISQNATELAKSRAEAFRNSEQLSRTLNSIGDAVIAVDAEMRITLFNPVASGLTGWTSSKAVGRSLGRVLDLRRRSNGLADPSPLPQAVSSGESVTATGELELFSTSGKSCRVACSASPVRSEDGKISGGVMVIRDITAEYEHRMELEKALSAARAAESAKSSFLSTISHEIRTPLNSVLGYVDLLQDRSISEEERMDYLSSIRVASDALMSLINDILDLSKLEAGMLKIKVGWNEVTSMLDEIRAVFHQSASAKGLRLECRCAATLPRLFIDRVRTRQIILNLVGNAIKFTGAGSVSVRVEFFRESSDKGTLLISVSDTGDGISEEFLPTLFEPFSQEDSEGKPRGSGGTGLGLSISKRLANAMGGDLTVRSRKGFGSTFTLTLPNVPCENTEVPGETPALPVLLVDDNYSNLLVLSRMLKKLKIEAVEANSAEAALEILAKQEVAAVLTDLRMPGADGVALATAIRALPGCENITIAVVTADVYAGSEFDWSNVDAILLKPVTMERLQSLLATGAGRRHDPSNLIFNELDRP